MGLSSYEPVDPMIPPQWAAAVVMDSLHCRKCGYDLQTLRADGRCPECGLDIWSTVQHAVDPAASRLPSLRNPRAVGDSLVALTLCILATMVLALVPTVSQLIDASDRSGLQRWSGTLPSLTWPFAVILELAALWSVRTLAPPRGSEPHGAVWNDLWRIVLGYTGWIAILTIMTELDSTSGGLSARNRFILHVAAATFAVVGLLGLRGVLDIIGHRSREYRRSQGGRQSLELMIAAVAAGVMAAGVYYFSRVGWLPRNWWHLVRTVVWVSNFMVVIGLVYLVVNAWWIRRSLRKPPPPLDQVLAPNLPRDTWIPDREE